MRLIDAEPIEIRYNTEALGRREMYEMVKTAPTIDAVPVVRCKDCEYYHQAFCEIWSKCGTIQTREQGFCYMAERKER